MKYIIILTVFYYTIPAFAQEITEENYLQEDSLVWEKYKVIETRMFQLTEKYPEKRDSLLTVLYEKELPSILRESRNLALKYAAVPSGLKRLFMVRLEIPKDTLSRILKSLSPEIRESFYGKCLHRHIITKQIEEGDLYFDFQGSKENGTEFHLSSLAGKRILLLYGGLGCMGEKGRTYLADLYQKYSDDNFEIVVFWPCSSLEELKEYKKRYPFPYTFVSDFFEDLSPVKITYGTQATPTCFFIDSRGIVKMRSEGFNPILCEQLLKE
ncbi:MULTISPECIES: peroxiredoxin family protein [Porphyromonadaceae]|uniref:Alkyl hydroperoxide reductase subunit C/ Thiol specific antioxidant domain-containing protein n=1 Tax=Sanguibacteroides justesenii TaxID=1547597 RepID=A0A0C3RB83_9PORP|nr:MULTISPECIES: TlpA disulfide reductase family protein [Porphyromonadaceae]KIO42931.1 hypothetical protein BA92_13820 [Sanguibacteroides justesenii]KIO46189.1 hypothetical protein IE90_05165 [Sanguibacteroides justesenii]PXZ44252.1 TlpA family protein disulfide reductase [Sanguibacteroides justesenii]